MSIANDDAPERSVEQNTSTGTGDMDKSLLTPSSVTAAASDAAASAHAADGGMELDSTPHKPETVPHAASEPPTNNTTTHSVANGADNIADATAPTVATEGRENNSEQAPPPPPPSKPLCGICKDNPGKYKCTRCQLPFCSVACNKIHRENHPPDPEPDPSANKVAEAIQPPASQQPAPDASNPFGMLDDSPQLRYLFKRYPRLPQQLLTIAAATDPPPDEAQPESLEQALLARAAAAGKPKKEQWNHDVGIRKGKEALRRARKIHGDDGEGLREYTELITHLIAQREAAARGEGEGREGQGFDAVIRGQAAQKDAELIRRLLEEDNR